MTDNQKKLLSILRDMFQFDLSDLDFGIYRIMHMKRDEINRFIEEELPAQVTAGLDELARLATTADIAAIDKQISDTKAASFSNAIKSAAVAELEDKKKSLAGNIDITAVEADVYNHLTNFFSRYYDDGDFISQRRYKDGVYAIPYEGEEVKLHWANADQYYVKTSEYFKDYVFRTAHGDVIRFKLIEADVERDNNKANEKRFFQLHADKPFEIIDGELFIYVEYKASEYSGKTAQAKHISEIVDAFVAVQTQAEFQPLATILTMTDGRTLLERQLNRYTARNTFDYFIHKDLGKFLRRELDFYIKNDVIYLDDIDEQDEAKTKEYLTKAKVIRKIARKVITFLAQIEDFQKKLYLKKKFVVETNYCITLDRVPEEMYPEIAVNDAQREEWVRLFAIDEIEATDDALVNAATIAYSVPLAVDFLRQNPFLVLDTVFFSTEFKERLIKSIDDLDKKLDGLLIHSENLQALKFLREKYGEKIKCVYIDPPYNTEQDRLEGKFLYKDNYEHSSWLAMMKDRLALAYLLQSKDGAISISINEDELYNLKSLLDAVYGCDNYLTTMAIKVRHENRILKGDKDFHEIYESLLSYRKSYGHRPTKKVEDNTSIDGYVYYIEVLNSPSYVITLGEKTVEIYDMGQYQINKGEPTSKGLKKISVRGSIREGNSSGRFYVAHIEPRSQELAGKLLKVPNMGADELGHRYFWCPSEESGRRNGDYFQGIPQNRNSTREIPYPNMYDFEGAFNDCTDEGGISFRNGKKPQAFMKQVFKLQNIVENKNALVLDYFAGSASSAHAVIDFNRDDGGHRKYILVEMGEYFNSVTKPRIQKVIYSMDKDNQKGWKDGKPVSRKGSSHAFKYLRLESYEDTLNNIVLSSDNYNILTELWEGYFLSYMLDTEAASSSCMLNVGMFDKPFSYKMNITRNLENVECNIDLVETFNYLIGLTVIKSHALVSFDADFAAGEYGAVSAALRAGDTYKFKAVEGTAPNGDKSLVIWREMTGDIEKDNATLDAYFLSLPNARSFKRIYVNCDNNLLNLRGDGESWQVILIGEEMKKRMFEDAE